MIVAFLSLSLHVHARSPLFRLKQNHKAEKRFAILIIVLSSSSPSPSFFLDREERERERESEEEIDEKERACDNTYSISIWKRQQADSSNSEEKKMTKEKLYYPIERTRAWSGWLTTEISNSTVSTSSENCSRACQRRIDQNLGITHSCVSRQKLKVMRKMWVSICNACDDSWWMWCIYMRVKSPANNT